MKTKKEKEISSVKKNIVNLLKRTFDKYKDISVIKRREEHNYESEEEEGRRTDTTVIKLNTLRYDPSKDGDSPKPKLCEEKKRAYHKLYKVKQYTPDEDEIIVGTMKSAETKSAGILQLIKILNRPYKSIKQRIEKLETGTGKRRYRPFSLQEDFLIIDNALKSLKQCKSLAETQLHDYEDLAKSLDRQGLSVDRRWSFQLKVWILQYYQKTLNLEIRPMLIDTLAENFDSIEDIDWDWVTHIPEFSGYSSNDLRKVFYTKILHHMARQLEVERTEITLTKLAETSNRIKFSNVSESVRKRQEKIIDYFEKNVEVENIEIGEMGK